MTAYFDRKNLRFFSFIIAFAIILLAGIFLRLELIGRSLEYDEIWTYLNYSVKNLKVIFTDLSTPNNHPLNSLFIKYFTQFLGADPFSIRLTALISGVIILIVAPLITFIISRNRFAALMSLLLCSLCPGLVYYSQTARGYMLQSMLILALTLFLILLQKNIYNKYICSVLIMVSGILSILALPTSVMFLIPLFISHLIYICLSNLNAGGLKNIIVRIIRENFQILAAYTIVALFSIFFYSINYSQFKAGQSFGYTISSFGGLVTFIYSTLSSLSTLPIILFFLLSFINRKIRFYSFSCLFLILLSLSFALITKAGPVRVYLPLICPIIIFASIGLSSAAELIKFNSFRYIIQLALLVISASFYYHAMKADRFSWINPDWSSAVRTAYASMPPNTYVTLPATSGYPTIFGFPQIFEIEEERTPQRKDVFLINLREGSPSENAPEYNAVFNGINPVDLGTKSVELYFHENPKIIDMSTSLGCYGEIYKLKRISGSSDLITPIFMSLITNDAPDSISIDSSEEIVIMNLWLRPLKLEAKHLTFIIKNKNISTEKLLKIEKQSEGQIRFYSIHPYTQ